MNLWQFQLETWCQPRICKQWLMQFQITPKTNEMEMVALIQSPTGFNSSGDDLGHNDGMFHH